MYRNLFPLAKLKQYLSQPEIRFLSLGHTATIGGFKAQGPYGNYGFIGPTDSYHPLSRLTHY